MKFKKFLFENMSIKDALAVFGLASIPSQEIIKNTYKKLAIDNHPDMGGSLDKMQKINAAYNILKQSKTDSWSKDDIKASFKKSEEMRTGKLKLIRERLSNAFNSRLFVNHFNSIFNETFIDTIKISDVGDAVYYTAEYTNKDRSIVFLLNFSGRFINSFSSALASAENDIDLYISSEILYKRKKVKLKNDRYSFEKSSKILSNPENIFPKDKILSKKDKETKFSKKDAITIFKLELNSKIDYNGNVVWASIPLYGDYNINLYRTTMLGGGSWWVNGLYIKNKKIAQTYFASYIENREVFNWLVDRILELRKITDQSTIEDFLNRMYQAYKGKFLKNV